MPWRGRAAPVAALGIAAFGSFIAGVLVTAALFVVGPALADFALAFGPAEYTALVLLGLLLVTQLSSGSQVDALLMVAFGLLLSTVGKDPIYGTERFTFHIFSLFDGLNIALLAMGVFGVAELLIMAEGGSAAVQPVVQPKRLLELLPNRADWRASALPILRGTGLGFFLGLLPGGGATLSSFSSYVLERRLAKAPERFGHGAIEGVAGPESANNAAAQSAFVPLLSLGIPANAVMGVILGALLIQGITPGPTLVANRPDIFFGVIASMLIGNLMLIVLNVPLISLFVQILRLPGSILAPLIIVFCVIGAYTLSNNVVEVIIMIGFGIAGYLMRKVDLDPAPLVLAFVLGNILETNFRQALLVGKGTLALFYTRPIAAVLIACSVALIALQVGRTAAAVMRRRRRERRVGKISLAALQTLCFDDNPCLSRRVLPHYRASWPISRRPSRATFSLHRPRRPRAKAGGASSRAPPFRSWWWRCFGNSRRISASFRASCFRRWKTSPRPSSA